MKYYRNEAFMILNNQRGGFLIAFILSFGIAVMTAGFYYNNQFIIQKISYNKLLYLKAFEALHDSVVNILFSQAAYVKTVKSVLNGDLEKCLRDPNYICPAGTRPLYLFIDNSTLSTPFLSMTTGDGLGVDLENCNSFPSISCPFRYELSWTAECDLNNSACVLPSIMISGVLAMHSQIPFKNVFNTDRTKLNMRLR